VQSGDIAQAATEEVFRDLLHIIKVHMDDILFHHKDWNEHLLMIDEVLRRLQEFGFAVNPLKCEWISLATGLPRLEANHGRSVLNPYSRWKNPRH